MEFPDDVYRDICCIKTLYSSKEGFFREFVEIILEKIEPDWIEDVFKKEESEEEKIRICCKEPKVWKAIEDILQNVCKLYRKKCSEASRLSKMDADGLRKDGNHRKAVMIYSQSIIRAPDHDHDGSFPNRSLAMAYQGRAESLFKLREYRGCLTDLNAALKEGFPTPLKYQIFWRMGECFMELSDLNKARISLQVALKIIDDQILLLEKTVLSKGNKSDTVKDIILKKVLDEEKMKIRSLLEHATVIEKETTKGVDLPDVRYFRGTLPEISGGSNENYPDASWLVTVKTTADAGRFAVAAARVDTGTTLVVEEPQAACLTPRMLASHCLHCFSRLFAAVPCKLCSGVAFCSEECRDSATSSYHKYECEFLGLFLGSGISVLSFLSYRMVAQETLSFFKVLYPKIKSMKTKQRPEGKTDFSERESRYLKVWNLMTHSRLRTGKDYFRRTLMALFLVKCLQKTDYFGSRPKEIKGKVLTEDEILIASIILHHLELLQFNAHEIYETRVSKLGQTRDAKTICVGVGIYPTVALFNHECAPSVTRYFNGKKIIIKAVRPIEKNEILSENYGPHYAKKSLYDRTRELTSRYWFRCQCKACVEDWPTVDNLANDHFRIRCKTPNCEGVFSRLCLNKSSNNPQVCRRCSKKTNATEALKRKSQAEVLFDKGLGYMDEHESPEAVPLLVASLNELFDLASPPCRQMFLCQEALRTCYAQTGNVWVLSD